MATSGTTSFSLPLDELIESAARRIGGQPLLDEEAESALRLVNLLFTDMQNRGLLLYTLQQQVVALTTAQATVSLSSAVLDVHSLVLRVSTSVDTALERVPIGIYAQQSNKTQEGQPTMYTLHRTRTGPTLYLWPAADDAHQLLVWAVRQVEDANALAQDIDAPRRYWPAMVSGLAYFMGMERPVEIQKLAVLKAQYEEDIKRALEESRDKASVYLVPYINRV